MTICVPGEMRLGSAIPVNPGSALAPLMLAKDSLRQFRSRPTAGGTDAEWLALTPADSSTRASIRCGTVAAEIIEIGCHDGLELRFRGPRHLLILREKGRCGSGEVSIDRNPPCRLHDFSGKFTFVPAGRTFHERQREGTSQRLICVYLDPRPAKSGAFVVPRVLFEDDVLRATVHKIARLVDQPDHDERDAAYLEALAIVLVREVERVNLTPDKPRKATGGLAPWQQRIVRSCIEDNLPERVDLVTLARLARLSPFHFCRAFKQTFGAPPHRYHIERRIDRAKRLLAESRMTVTDIGLAVGFAETSSFSATFRRVSGLTPTAYRRITAGNP